MTYFLGTGNLLESVFYFQRIREPFTLSYGALGQENTEILAHKSTNLQVEFSNIQCEEAWGVSGVHILSRGSVRREARGVLVMLSLASRVEEAAGRSHPREAVTIPYLW